jgi:hypothetical protein
MEKFSFRLDRKVVAGFILVVGTYFAFTHDVKTAQATTNPSGLTGQYGCVLNRLTSGFNVAWTGANITTSAVISLNYSDNSAKGLLIKVANYNQGGATTSTVSGTDSFTETAVSDVPNTYKYVFGDTSTPPFVGIVVNSGNTILMTQVEHGSPKASFSGVCQKV